MVVGFAVLSAAAAHADIPGVFADAKYAARYLTAAVFAADHYLAEL
jgi:hypothetical protein